MYSQQHTLARRANRMRGIGLVELMIAVTIGLVLIAGALSVFVNSRATYNTNQQIARLLENGNYALEEITRSLKLAGYWGRNNIGTLVRRRLGDSGHPEIHLTSAAVGDCTVGWYADLSRRVEGLNGRQWPTPVVDANTPYQLTCIPDNRYESGTDILVVRHVEPAPVAALAANTVYIRADPANAELFVGTTAPAAGFTPIASNYLLRSEAFYVSSFNLTLGDGVPTLKRASLEAGPVIRANDVPVADEIIIPGIENMQIQYAVDLTGDGSANQYVDADKVAATSWDNVVAVRVWLIVRSEVEDGQYTNTANYRMPDRVYTPNPPDGFRRVVMSRTIELRN